MPKQGAPSHTPDIKPADLIHITTEEWIEWVVEEPVEHSMDFAKEIGYQMEVRDQVREEAERYTAPPVDLGESDYQTYKPQGMSEDALHRALVRVLPEHLEFSNVAIFTDTVDAVVTAVCGRQERQPE